MPFSDTLPPRSDRVSRRDPWRERGRRRARTAEKPALLVGHAEGRNDLEGGQFANWVTNRACVVRADGTRGKCSRRS